MLLWKKFWWFHERLNIELPYDQVIPLLGIYSTELKIETKTDICRPVFITALFMKGKNKAVYMYMYILHFISLSVDEILFSHEN